MTDKTLHLQITLADNGYIITTNGRPTMDDPMANRRSETLIAADKDDVLALIGDRLPQQPTDFDAAMRRAHESRNG